MAHPAVYKVWHQTAGPQRGTRRAVQGLSHSHLMPMYMYMCMNMLCARGVAYSAGTCLTALLRRETVGNTTSIPRRANVTDTPGHLGVPGSRMLVRPPKVQTSAFTCVA